MELNRVEETLLIPLVIKANETLRKKPRITDNKAVEILKELNIDRISLSKFDKFISHEGVVARTIMLDAAVKKAINQWPNANIISIGCGLDARFERVDNGIINWYNLDFPNVIELRKKFFDENPRVHLIAKSALDASWPTDIKKGSKTIIILEGILMYFSKDEVEKLFNIIKENFDGAIIMAELMAELCAKNGGKNHDTVKNTNAKFKWGVKTAKDVELLCPGLKTVSDKSLNVVMKRYTLRGKLFAAIPFIKDMNDRLAIYSI